MPTIYKRDCDQCGEYYEGQGREYCSNECRAKAGRGEMPVPPSEMPRFDTFWRLTGDAIITSDWHTPYYDADLAGKMLAVARRFRIKRHICAGDFFNQDTFSHYPQLVKIFKEDREFTDEERKKINNFKHEKKKVRELLTIFTKHFDSNHFLLGNHDIRLLRTLEFDLDLDDLWDLEAGGRGARIAVSNYPYCELTSGDRKFRITHPKNYSQITNRVAYRLSAKHRCSIIVAHGHFMGISKDASGRDYIIDSGGMFDPATVPYRNLSDTTHDEWNPGFIIVRDGYPYLFPKDTDWEFWLNKVRIAA